MNNCTETNQLKDEAISIIVKKSLYGELSLDEQLKFGEIYSRIAPRKIYRYRRADYEINGNNYDLTSLREDKLWLANPASFNDPFDCRYRLNVDDLIEGAEKLAKKYLSISSVSDDFRRLFRDKAIKNSERLKELFESQRKYIDSMRVAWFSEDNDNIQLWGYYANAHKGICVEYDIAQIQGNKRLLLAPIRYVNEYEKVILIEERALEEGMIRSSYTKSSNWKNEKEWRIVENKDTLNGREYDNGTLVSFVKPTSIYLGCMAEDKLIDDVAELCKESDIALYQMSIDNKKYKLNPRKIL